MARLMKFFINGYLDPLEGNKREKAILNKDER
jgi:hypothetical protein